MRVKITLKDCGTGAGGFQPGNTCGAGGGSSVGVRPSGGSAIRFRGEMQRLEGMVDIALDTSEGWAIRAAQDKIGEAIDRNNAAMDKLGDTPETAVEYQSLMKHGDRLSNLLDEVGRISVQDDDDDDQDDDGAAVPSEL